MPSSYTKNLGLEKPATGEQAGVWGTTANLSYDTLDMAIDGSLGIALSASTYSLQTNNGGAPAPGINRLITWTGTQTSQGTVTISPNTVQKIYYMRNQTAGGFAVQFTQGSGANFVLQPGYTAVVYSDGGGATGGVFAALDNPQFANVLVTGNLTVNGAVNWTTPQTVAQPVTFTGAVTITAPTSSLTVASVTVATTPAATLDMYYRSSGGALAAIPVGSVGQVLTVATGPVIQWAAPAALSIGGSIPSSIANAVYFSGASNTLDQDSYVMVHKTVGLGVGIFPQHSIHLGYSRQPEICLDTNDPGTQWRQITWATNNSPRWQLVSYPAVESGSNVASDLGFIGWNDAASSTRWVIYMTRANGNVTIGSAGGDQAARLAVVGDNSGQVVSLFRGTAGQTAMLAAWQNSAAANVVTIDPAGNLTATSLIAGNGITGTFTVYATGGGYYTMKFVSGVLVS